MDDLNSVNAEQVVSVEPQEVEIQNQETLTDASEVNSQANEKSEQSEQENSVWKQMRVEKEQAEQRATRAEQDREIAKTYGYEYGVFSQEDIANKYGHLGITTVEQLEDAIEKETQDAAMRARGIDPDALAKEVEEHPDVKKAREQKKKAEIYSEFEDWYIENKGSKPDIENLPESVKEAFTKGKSMKIAYLEYDYKNLQTKMKAQEINQANANSSPGSVTGNGNAKDTTLTPEMINNMTDKERMSRWPEIKKVLNMK